MLISKFCKFESLISNFQGSKFQSTKTEGGFFFFFFFLHFSIIIQRRLKLKRKMEIKFINKLNTQQSTLSSTLRDLFEVNTILLTVGRYSRFAMPNAHEIESAKTTNGSCELKRNRIKGLQMFGQVFANLHLKQLSFVRINLKNYFWKIAFV